VRRLSAAMGAAIGGACGGWLVGLGEALLISATSAPEEFGLFPFAILAYGALGGVLGLAAGAAVVALGWATGWPAIRHPMSLAAALTLGSLGFVLALYHGRQRLFGEDLVLLSGLGVVVHIGLVVLAALAAYVLYRLARSLEARQHGHVLAIAGSLIVLVGALFANTSLAPGTVAEKGPTLSPDAESAQRDSRPNVILIVLDTLRADAVESARVDRAGGIGRLARDGTVFTQAHAQASWTRPSMASLFTSLYPSQHGAVQKADILRDDVTTLAEAFSDAGYRTAGFTTNINLAPIFNFQQGFTDYFYLAPKFYFGATDSATRLAIYKGLRVVREQLFRDRIHFENYYQDARVVGDAVADWIAGEPPQPFFLFLHYMDPHDPYFEMPYNGRGIARVTNHNPAASRAAELHALYGQGVAYNDAELDRVLELVDANGAYDDSVIVLTSDHGEEFQEHGGWWHGTTLYQEQLHVPLIIKAAQESDHGEGSGASDDRIVELIDVAPTLLAAAGIAPPPAFAGRDLADGDDDQVVFAEEDHEGNRLVSLRLDAWKLIVANPDNPRGLAETELYDLAADPKESRNLATDFPEKVDELMMAMTRKRVLLRNRR